MKTIFVRPILPGVLLLAALAGCKSDKESEPKPEPAPAAASTAPPSRNESALVTMTATVEAIDVPSREVTLRGPHGDVATFVVDERVQRLPEVKVGDTVTAEYYVALAAELRPPTAEEKAAPLTVVEASARAPKGTSPAGGGLRRLKVVATIEKLDPETRTVTLKGPRGNSLSVRARSEENFKKLTVGETIVVTYTEALAISLNKAGTK